MEDLAIYTYLGFSGLTLVLIIMMSLTLALNF